MSTEQRLLRVKTALTIKSEALSVTPKAKEEALRCIEITEIFERNENALGVRSMALSALPKFAPIEIEGVMVSIHPDVWGRHLPGRKSTGCRRR